MQIIDFRFRPNTSDAVDGLINSPFFKDMCNFLQYPERAWSTTLEEAVRIMNEHRIIGVITGRDAETTYGCPSSNMAMVAILKAYPQNFYGMAGLDPHKHMSTLDELKQMVEQYGAKGASIDPYLSKLPADHRLYYPIYAKCCELGVPVVISTGPATRVPGAIMADATPMRVDEVARDFPDLTVIMSHGGYPFVQDAIMVCHRNKNVYMDLSEYETWPGAAAYFEAANELIPDKILFASAHPFYDSWARAELYKSFGLRQDVLENLLYNNAARVLGLA
jgi:predicted TIM-barrel fold metal-dependent hydrolase